MERYTAVAANSRKRYQALNMGLLCFGAGRIGRSQLVTGVRREIAGISPA